MGGDADLLRALAVAFANGGWETALLAGDGPVRLHIWRPSAPAVRETVTVSCERDGAWFRSSAGELMARCTDVRGAVAHVARRHAAGVAS